MTETDDRKLVQSVQRISDRQLLLAKDPKVMLDHAREEAWHLLQKEARRHALAFNEAKVEVVWELRMSLLTEPDPDEVKRREVLKAWSEQDSPRLLAPNHQMGVQWLDMNRDLVPGLTKTTGVVGSGRGADQALRGYRGTLLIVSPEERNDGDPWRDFWRSVYEITSWGHFSTWTEFLP